MRLLSKTSGDGILTTMIWSTVKLGCTQQRIRSTMSTQMDSTGRVGGFHDIRQFIGVEKSMRKAKKNIGSKNGLEKACKSGDFTKKEECEADKRSYSHRIGAKLDSLES
ncbi:hypothetical protein PIB30_091685 [Stylosanthes scabra]|uniref:Uncharacterized protein n=1 Tax=Stylosanthes scabra TaxID=79078 RepID=A0ABU6SW15_9FABA|nr:hypothetical protein [Stylosanthes scabra]